MKPIRAAIIGYGNIGRYVLEALRAAEDFAIAGIVRRNPSAPQPLELQDISVEGSISGLSDVDVAILACPSRKVGETAEALLRNGIRTVDSFDIHTEIVALRRTLDKVARQNNTAAIVAAGWDPGSDSVVRTLMQAMVPSGLTYTNFGPGMSMGHTVAVKAIEGVEEALSVTIPTGTGIHRRMVYVKLAKGASKETVRNMILTDDYFKHDETFVSFVDAVAPLIDMGHAVNMTRKGVSGSTHNQLLSFDMQINNPALTAQILVASARAALLVAPGAYTLLEIPVLDLLPGDREQWIAKLC